MPTNKKQTGVRLSEKAHRIIDRLRERMGVTSTGAIEYALRRTAEADGLVIEDPAPGGGP